MCRHCQVILDEVNHPERSWSVVAARARKALFAADNRPKGKLCTAKIINFQLEDVRCEQEEEDEG